MDAFLAELVGAVKALGIGGGPVFALLWWLERKDRREAWRAHNGLLERVVRSNDEAAAALDKLAIRVEAGGG